MGGGFHMAGPEADIRKSLWVNYTIEMLNDPYTHLEMQPQDVED